MSNASPPADLAALGAHLRALLAESRDDEVLELVLGLLTQARDKNNDLELRLRKLLKDRFGRKSEKVSAAQLSLLLAQLGDSAPAVEVPATEAAAAPDEELPRPAPKPDKGHGRRPLPPGLPRDVRRREPSPEERTCQRCGGEKECIGEEHSETLEFVPATFRVIHEIRVKCACRPCGDGVVIAPPAEKVIERGLPGPGLLAHVLLSKYQDHVPLNRLSGIYRRERVELAVSTLADWVGAGADALEPLAREIHRRALASYLLQSDDTGLRVLDKDHAKGSKRGHMWLHLGDGKWAGFVYTPNWKGEGPHSFLAGRHGWLLVDGYKGYENLFTREGATAIEVSCWSHARRGFIEVLEDGDVRAAIPVQLISQIFAVESQAKVDGVDPVERLRRRVEQSRPVLLKLGEWLAKTYNLEPPKSTLGKAITYMVKRWAALNRFLEDGRIPIHNNACENGLRGIAVGRKNYLFAGSDAGAERAAILYTVLATARLHEIAEPWAYLRDVLAKLASGWPASRLAELLPDVWRPPPAVAPVPAASAALPVAG